jgi:aspartate racemase
MKKIGLLGGITCESSLLYYKLINELALWIIRPAARETVGRLMAGLVAQGAQAVILGCTELPLLITRDQGDIPLFDTTGIHARATVDLALA